MAGQIKAHKALRKQRAKLAMKLSEINRKIHTFAVQYHMDPDISTRVFPTDDFSKVNPIGTNQIPASYSVYICKYLGGHASTPTNDAYTPAPTFNVTVSAAEDLDGFDGIDLEDFDNDMDSLSGGGYDNVNATGSVMPTPHKDPTTGNSIANTPTSQMSPNNSRPTSMRATENIKADEDNDNDEDDEDTVFGFIDEDEPEGGGKKHEPEQPAPFAINRAQQPPGAPNAIQARMGRLGNDSNGVVKAGTPGKVVVDWEGRGTTAGANFALKQPLRQVSIKRGNQQERPSIPIVKIASNQDKDLPGNQSYLNNGKGMVRTKHHVSMVFKRDTGPASPSASQKLKSSSPMVEEDEEPLNSTGETQLNNKTEERFISEQERLAALANSEETAARVGELDFSFSF